MPEKRLVKSKGQWVEVPERKATAKFEKGTLLKVAGPDWFPFEFLVLATQDTKYWTASSRMSMSITQVAALGCRKGFELMLDRKTGKATIRRSSWYKSNGRLERVPVTLQPVTVAEEQKAARSRRPNIV